MGQDDNCVHVFLCVCVMSVYNPFYITISSRFQRDVLLLTIYLKYYRLFHHSRRPSYMSCL